MAKASPINNLDQLEKEIYRLKDEARKIEDKMDKNMDHLQRNFGSMLRNSVFPRKEESAGSSWAGSLLEHEGLKSALQRFFSRLADKAADGVDGFVERVFKKE